MKTYAQQLIDVQEAITAIESGAQSYSISGRSLSRGNLKDLYEREKWLRKQVDRESRGGIRIRGGTPT